MRIGDAGKRSLRGLLIFGGLFLLAGCGGTSNVVASLNDRIITREELDKADQLFSAVAQATEDATDELTRKKEVLRQLVYEEVIQQDKSLSGYAATADAQRRFTEIKEALGGDKGFQAQLKGFSVTEAELLQSLEKQALAAEHRRRYDELHPADDETLLKFFQKNPRKYSMVTYEDIMVPTRSEAADIRKELSGDSEFAVLQERYNNDLFDSTSALRVEKTKVGDGVLFTEEILQQELNEPVIHYEEGRYHVVLVLERIDDFATLRDHIKACYLDQQYQSYIKTLCQDAHLRLYYDRIASPKAKTEGQSGK